MTQKRFVELVVGTLNHSLGPAKFRRIEDALKAVVDATGEAGERALEDYCRQLRDRDEQARREIPW